MHLRDVPRLDVVLAAAILAAGVAEIAVTGIPHAPVALGTTVLASASLAFRRVAPIPVMVVCVGAQVVNEWAGVPPNDVVIPVMWILISLYSLARYSTLRAAVTGGLAALAMFGTTLFRDPSDWLFGLVVLTGPWLVGRAIRASVRETAELSGRMSDLERRRESELAAALSDERARIARDLHDVIAHSVTVMVVQAGAAQQVMGTEPERADAALDIVQDAGRQALSEMNALLGMLHDPASEDGLRPQPGVDQIHALVEQSTRSGIPASLEVVGEPRALAPGVQVSLYRIVQESLTNIHKHSSARHARVCLTYSDTAIQVDVEDDGTPTGDGVGGQRGIVGMRERVAIYGGTLEAGPSADGGFDVHARIPLEGH